MYSRSITRDHRSAFVLVLDLSNSMQDVIEYRGDRISKGEALAQIRNKVLQELVMRAMRGDTIRDYYDVAVIAYSGDKVFSMLNNDIDNPFVSITKLRDVADHPMVCLTPLSSVELFRESVSNPLIVVPEGSTPMYEALYYVKCALQQWCSREENRDSASPMVYNITDGHPTDSELVDIVNIANRIMKIGTNGGKVLLFNIHLEVPKQGMKLIFPSDEQIDEHPSSYVRCMGRASSVMPEQFEPMIAEICDRSVGGRCRGVGYSVSVLDLLSMISIGTLSVDVK